MINYIRVKDVVYENFQDYKKTSMMLATCFCDWKCLIEKGLDINICQNSAISKQDNITLNINNLIEAYLKNPITNAIVIGGLEPLKQFDEVLKFIHILRNTYECNDDVVIYTGYYPNEIQDELNKLIQCQNIIVKFGRFEINSEKIFDDVLGVCLNSSNQWADKIS